MVVEHLPLNTLHSSLEKDWEKRKPTKKEMLGSLKKSKGSRLFIITIIIIIFPKGSKIVQMQLGAGELSQLKTE